MNEFIEILLQDFSTFDLIYLIAEIPGIILSVLLTLFLITKRRISRTAWLYAFVSISAYFYRGLTLSNAGIWITINWAIGASSYPFLIGFIGIISGYILQGISISQYLRDRRASSAASDGTE